MCTRPPHTPSRGEHGSAGRDCPPSLMGVCIALVAALLYTCRGAASARWSWCSVECRCRCRGGGATKLLPASRACQRCSLGSPSLPRSLCQEKSSPAPEGSLCRAQASHAASETACTSQGACGSRTWGSAGRGQERATPAWVGPAASKTWRPLCHKVGRNRSVLSPSWPGKS